MHAPAGRTRVEGRELRDDVDGRRGEPDFLLRLAQRRREQVGVTAARACRPAARAGRRGGRRRRPGRRARRAARPRRRGRPGRARRPSGASAHQASCRSRSSIDSRRRITRADAVADENGGGSRDAVVVRGHRERVGAGRGHGEEVAAARRRERDIVDQHVARLAVHPGDADDLVGRLVDAASPRARCSGRRRAADGGCPTCRRRRRPRSAREPLHAADAIERDAGRPDEAAARLEPHLGLGEARPRRTPCGRCVAALAARLAASGDVVVGVVPDPEPAAEVRDARDPAELVAAARGERGEPLDRLSLRVEVRELRADVDVDAEHSSPRSSASATSARACSGGSPNFEPWCPVRIASWVSASTPSVTRTSARSTPAAAASSASSSASSTTGAPSAAAWPRNSLVLVVAVDDERVARQARRARERELARRPRRPRRSLPRAGAGAARRSGTPSRRRRRRPSPHGVAQAGRGRGSSPRRRRRAGSRAPPRASAAAIPPSASAPRRRRAESGRKVWHRPIVPVTVETVQQLLT